MTATLEQKFSLCFRFVVALEPVDALNLSKQPPPYKPPQSTKKSEDKSNGKVMEKNGAAKGEKKGTLPFILSLSIPLPFRSFDYLFSVKFLILSFNFYI